MENSIWEYKKTLTVQIREQKMRDGKYHTKSASFTLKVEPRVGVDDVKRKLQALIARA